MAANKNKIKNSQASHDEDFEIDDSIYRKLESAISEKEQKATDNRMLLAKKIASSMKAKGWKQIDLAKALGDKDPSIISRWLSGTHTFTTETLWEISEILNIELISLGLKDANIDNLTQNLSLKDDIINALYYQIYEKDRIIDTLKRTLAIMRDMVSISFISSSLTENIYIKERHNWVA